MGIKIWKNGKNQLILIIMQNNSKIYIAGHTGLVGSAIHRKLIEKGYSNFVFTPYPEYDLINQEIVKQFFEKEKPEYVFLAAAKVGGIIANNTYRAQFIYENLQIQNNIIHFSYLYGVKKLLFLGSSCIYPKNCPQPIKEEYLLTSELEYTNEPYAIAKIAGLKMCESYNIQYGTNFIAVMPTNLFGPNDNFDLEKSHVLPALIRKMHLAKCLENNDWTAIRKDLDLRPIERIDGKANQNNIINILNKYGIFVKDNSVIVKLWGTGTPRREFLFSDDLADACVFLMENINFNELIQISLKEKSSVFNNNNQEIKNTHINIGTGKDITIKELAQMIKNIVGFKGIIEWDSLKPDGTMQKLLDVTKLHDLGWIEKINLSQGIELVYNNYKG
jgi:GDP-L-fucose synthase